MRTTRFKVENRRIERIEEVSIVGDENVDTFSFEFDSEWDNYSIKEIIFLKDGEWIYSNLNENNEVILPTRIYGSTEFEFGITGKSSTSQLSTPAYWINTSISIYLSSGDPDNLPGKEAWDIYTEEMLSLINQGRLTLEECNQILTNMRTYYENAIAEMEQMRDATEGYKNDAQDILGNCEDVRQDIIDMGSARTFATFYIDAKTGDLYIINAPSLGNMGFSVQGGDLYVNINSEVSN